MPLVNHAFCPRDTRPFRHFRRFAEFEQAKPLFYWRTQLRHYCRFVKNTSFGRDKGTVHQRHCFWDPDTKDRGPAIYKRIRWPDSRPCHSGTSVKTAKMPKSFRQSDLVSLARESNKNLLHRANPVSHLGKQPKTVFRTVQQTVFGLSPRGLKARFVLSLSI